LQPLLGAGILSFVFGSVAGLPSPAGIPYFLFSLVGMIAWNFFSQIATRGSTSLLSNASLVQKTFFPRLLLPLSTALATCVDLVVSVGLLAVAMIIEAYAPGLPILSAAFWLAFIGVAALGLALMCSALMVRYRDVQYVLPFAIQLLLFLSPVAYSLQSVPRGSRFFYELNPLAGLLEGFRWSVLSTPRPPAGLIAYSTISSLLILAAGAIVFHRLERSFADVI
jgi:lipopolysaccharide transport system permease protein